MCLAIPSKIIKVEDMRATVDVYGAQRDISLLVLQDEVKVGDYVIVHAGFAIQKLHEDVAKETLGYFNEYLAATATEEEGFIEKPARRTKTKVGKKARSSCSS
jgi:hydrogenase expression/formation protein HypC